MGASSTALVNEAFLRLADARGLRWQDRVLHLSNDTIKRDWRLARLWLFRQLEGGMQ